jgi:hypothetical protein
MMDRIYDEVLAWGEVLLALVGWAVKALFIVTVVTAVSLLLFTVLGLFFSIF